MTARYAIYFTPSADDALARFGAGVLGYDCADGTDVPQLPIGGIAPDTLASLTAEPRRYGFHATLTAPFRLGHGEAELRAAAATFARTRGPVPLGLLQVTRLGSFIALCPAQKQPGIAALEAACVHTFHRFRAPLSATERERRLKARLTPHQITLLDQWGYPYVLDQFRLHMTLTGPLPAERIDTILQSLKQAYAPLAATPVTIDAISLVRQDGARARFRVLERFALATL